MSVFKTIKSQLMSQVSARISGSEIHNAQAKAPASPPHPLSELEDKIDLERLLVIPVCEEPHEEQNRSAHFSMGQFLARQERWDDLADLVAEKDADRETTMGGIPIAELLCQGARSDVVAMAEHMLLDDAPDDISPLTEGISALETVLSEFDGNYVIAATVALAHLDIAWAWRGTETDSDTPARHLEAFRLHCNRAQAILDPFCGIELDSPFLTATRCALLVGNPEAASRVADDYEDLIDLAPEQHRHIRALGHYMLPQWFGSYQKLELEARRTAARTQDIWGAGAYTWAFFDALLVDPNCAAVIDVPFFLEGISDILDRAECQNFANIFASFTGVSIAKVARTIADNPEASAALDDIQAAAQWIMSDYLHELHPLIWGHSVEGFDNQARIASVDALFKQGRDKADQVFMRFFGDQMRKGNALIFTPQGLYVQQA